MQKKSRNSRGKKRAMETHFYTMEFFCPFTRIFLYTSRKIPYNFFLCCVRISRVMKAKKSRNSRGKTRAMETHFYIMEFFFLSPEFSYEHSERFLTIFFNAVFVFSEEWMQKKSRHSKGNTQAMETHVYTTFLVQ